MLKQRDHDIRQKFKEIYNKEKERAETAEQKISGMMFANLCTFFSEVYFTKLHFVSPHPYIKHSYFIYFRLGGDHNTTTH